jgi:8-oxo-dGTP diphosphatase
MDFVGAKVALLNEGRVLAYLRDDLPDLRWPGLWDLPGGGREGAESPEACALREIEEEFGLRFGPERLLRGWQVPAMLTPERSAWFFTGTITKEEIAAIRFGDEGQFWEMMPLMDFLIHPMGIPPLQDRLAMALTAMGVVLASG